MTSKERVRLALHREVPDRVPFYADFVPELKAKMLEYFHTDDYYEMCVRAGNDMLLCSAGIGNSYYGEQEEYVCPWGCRWKYFSNSEGRYTEIIDHPLADDEDGEKLAAYKIPDPQDDSLYEEMRRVVKKYGDTHFITGGVTCSIFEAAWYLHGLDDTVIDMSIHPDYADALFDKVMEFPLRAGLRFIEEGADMIWLGDDVGMQQTMLISPEMWRRFLKPRMARLIRAYKEKNPDILVAYHSCGYILPIIDELIEIGLDVLNPVQPLAMDPAVLKEKFGDRLSFWGAICIQKTLPQGSEQDIRDEVELRMRTIGKGGGYMVSPAHTVQADTSLENLLALYKAVRELGVY